MQKPEIPTAAHVMTRDVVTLRPDTSLICAMRTLVEHRISGAPVIDEEGRLRGILTEYDCLRVLTSGQFSQDNYDERARVASVMTTAVEAVPPELDLFSLAHKFLERRIRRLPVVAGDRLVGLVSRRDVLRGFEMMRATLRRIPEGARPKGLYLSASDPDGDEISSRLE